MKKKTSLHALIKAMSRAEKRYFTLDARKSGRDLSRYLQLFQAINAQEIYDEASLKKKFGQRLTDDKGRLYEAILRAMRDYRSQRSRTARIKELLLDARFLYERGLYEQANLRLQSASRIATELEDHLSILEINREFRRVLNTLTKHEDVKTLNELIETSTNSLQLLKTEFQNLNVFDQLIREVQRNKAIGQTPSQTITEGYESLLFSSTTQDSIRAKLRLYQSRAIYCQLLGDKEGVYKNFKEAVDCWNQHPSFKQEDFNRYLNDAFNLLHASFNYPPATKEASILLDKLGEEQPHNIHDKTNLFQRTATYRIFYAINYDTNILADDILLPIKAQLEDIDLHPVSELTIRFNGAILYFIQKQYDKCDDWLQSVIEQKNNQLRPDITRSARLMQLIILVEQDEYNSYLEAQLRSEQRQLRKATEVPLNNFGMWLISKLKTYLNLPFSEKNAFLEKMAEEINTSWDKLPLEFNQVVLMWIKTRLKNK